MSTQTVSLRRAAIWNLKKQGLLEPFSDPVQAVKGLVAAQAQDYPSVRYGIAARTAGDHSEDGCVDELISYGGPLTRIWTVRGTLHIVPSDEANLHLAATRHDWLTRWGKYLERRLDGESGRERAQNELYPRIAEVLGSEGVTATEIGERLNLPPDLRKQLPHILKEMCYLGLTVRGPQTGNRALYLKPWFHLPDGPAAADADGVVRSDAQRRLIERFIGCYGPVTYQDIGQWSGFRVGDVKQALGRLADSLTTVALEDSRHPAYILEEDLDGLMALDTAVTVPDINLPSYDGLLLAYRDRRRFIDDELLSEVFLSAARVEPIVLRDARVAGVWDMSSCR